MAKPTAFYQLHLKHKAKLVDFAGYLMPIQYRGIVEEHKKVRSKVGIFDLSHMGEFIVIGKDAEDFLQKVTVNDVKKLWMYQVQYTVMCYPDGGIVDDLLVYKLPDRWMLVVNAANIEKDWNWLEQKKFGDVTLENISDETALLAIQGPLAEKVMNRLTDYDLSQIKFYWGMEENVLGNKILFSRTGYTGEDGFELYFEPKLAEKIWEAALEAGKELEIEPIGLGARDSLRLEMKYMLYGNDIDQTTNPMEAGLSWLVKLDKGDFIGKEAILNARQNPKRSLMAFEMVDKAFPRQHYEIRKNGAKIGEVTSGIFSPSLEKGIGLGYVLVEESKVGNQVEIKIRDKNYKAVVVKPPFWKNYSHK
ncbi:MAG: Aminomethyltransferase [candidate division Zixibacteria bacterium RBG-1]|nr:MAG: Aminomethyltransferase [candidate division Zixibacteria bacterium RBG-1]OGC85888.1 MAG: glycine cleavage system protein T [candidate division Zixibacteria bacterium RBG_19FT_COMBO_42_43]